MLCTATHSTSVSGTKSTLQLCSIKSPIPEESDGVSASSESSGSSESLDCSSESLVASLSSGSSGQWRESDASGSCSTLRSGCSTNTVFVEQPERNVGHEPLALLSLHWPVNCVATSTILTCVPSESWQQTWSSLLQSMFDRVFLSEKYKATYSIGSKTNVSKSRRKKEDKRKARKRSSLAVENRKSRASVIFLSLPQGEGGGGAPVDCEYVPEKYGVPSIDVDLDGLG